MNTHDPRQGFPSASKMERIAKCPGSLARERLTAVYPVETDEEKAMREFGTNVHALLAGDDGEYTADEMQAAMKCEQIRHLVALAVNSEQPDDCDSIGRLWNNNRTGLTFSGEIDCLMEWPDAVCIIDYKLGYKEVVEAAGNLQLRTYAVLYSPFLNEGQKLFVAIIQPNLSPGYSIAEYDRDSLPLAKAQIEEIVKAAMADNAEVMTGQHCRYCRARGWCPEYLESMQVCTNDNPIPIIGVLRNEGLSVLAARIPMARMVIKTIENEVRARLERDPHCIPGVTLQPSAPREKVTNIVGVWEKAKATFPDLKSESFLSACSCTKKALKDMLKPIAPAKGLTDALNGILAGNTETKPTNPRLVYQNAIEDATEE